MECWLTLLGKLVVFAQERRMPLAAPAKPARSVLNGAEHSATLQRNQPHRDQAYRAIDHKAQRHERLSASQPPSVGPTTGATTWRMRSHCAQLKPPDFIDSAAGRRGAAAQSARPSPSARA